MSLTVKTAWPFASVTIPSGSEIVEDVPAWLRVTCAPAITLSCASLTVTVTVTSAPSVLAVPLDATTVE